MCAFHQNTFLDYAFIILHVIFFDIFQKLQCVTFLKIGYPDQTVVFQTPERICFDYRHYYGSEKRVKVFFLVKFDLKIVFSLPVSVRDT